MSNDDKIKAWLARKASATEAQHSAASPSEPVEEVLAPPLDASPSAGAAVLAWVIAGLRNAPNRSVRERHQVYQALADRVEQQLHEHAQAGDQAWCEFHRRLFRSIRSFVEPDIRSGADVYQNGYTPGGLDERLAQLLKSYEQQRARHQAAQAKDARRRATALDVPMPMPLSDEEQAELAVVGKRMQCLHASQVVGRVDGRTVYGNVYLPLLAHAFALIRGESRVALLWALIGPFVLLSLISSLYFLMGTRYVLGMAVPSFSLTGATTWIMFRQIVFRTSTGFVSARSLLNLPSITPITLALVNATVYLLIYLVVFATLITLGYSIGLIMLPYDWVRFVLYVMLMGVGGASLGIIFGSVATVWPYFLRFAAAIERLLELFSSVFFVSEQLPEQYRAYLLWSPFAHGMQLLRSAYFYSYQSHDAQLGYYITCLVLLFAAALVMARSVGSRVAPA